MRRKVNTLTWLVAISLALNVGAAAYLIWTGTQDPLPNTLKAVEERANEILSKVEQTRAEIDGLYYQIEQTRDTIEVIQQKRITNNNTYVQNISRILANDSSAQFREYRGNSTKFDSLFFDGFFFNRLPR